MTGFTVSALLAVVGGALVIILGFLPYVGWSYRRRGHFSLGHAFIVACAAVYLLALWTYTILPLPDPALVCVDPAEPQLRPGQFLRDFAEARAGGTGRAVLAQVLLNVLLFVPLGMLARHLFRLGLLRTLLLGLGVSALIELTQLTGTWGLYPCAYRLMDVDDLIANTVGAGVGVALAPLLRLVPDQRAADARQPQPVTARRRILGMIADVTAVQLVTTVVWVAVGSLLLTSGRMNSAELAASGETIQGGLSLVVATVLLVVVPLLGHGATPGQRLVMLRPRTEAGGDPTRPQRLLRAVVGSYGYLLLESLGGLTGSALLGGAATVLGLASLVVAARGDHRGLSGWVARVRVVDVRVPGTATTDAERWAAMPELRQLWLAVAAGAASLHLLYLALVDQATLGGDALATWTVVAVVGFTAVSQVVLLILNGLVMLRREGRSLGNLLTLLLGAALVALTGMTVVTMAAGSGPLLVAVGALWAVVAYLGLVFWAFVLYGLLYARRDPTPGADSVVVLGSGIFGTRVPPLLAGRLARGREVLEAELARGGDAVLVCSGGQGPGEDVPEAVAMADHLVDGGLSPDLVRRESASRTTEENLELSLALLAEEGRGERVVVVTNDYHAFRAAIITRELGLVAQVVGAPTARYFLPSAILREFVGVLARNPWPHVIVAGLIGALALLVGRTL